MTLQYKHKLFTISCNIVTKNKWGHRRGDVFSDLKVKILISKIKVKSMRISPDFELREFLK